MVFTMRAIILGLIVTTLLGACATHETPSRTLQVPQSGALQVHPDLIAPQQANNGKP
jgi:uncharacterized lipoprotein YmbA